MAALSRWVARASFVQKWTVLGIAIGVIAGLGAVVFYEALQLATHVFLEGIAGYRPPTSIGDGNLPGSSSFPHPWVLPLVVAGGGLLGGILVSWISPSAAGHGTDAAIDAIHHDPRGIQLRTVAVKIVASALTIGSGGSAGREGPTGQISAGFGSLLARTLDLSDADAKIAVATGVGAGIGSIFGAPLGGAVLSAEILYRDDIDPAALLPSFVAAGTGYAIFGSVEGFTRCSASRTTTTSPIRRTCSGSRSWGPSAGCWVCSTPRGSTECTTSSPDRRCPPGSIQRSADYSWGLSRSPCLRYWAPATAGFNTQ